MQLCKALIAYHCLLKMASKKTAIIIGAGPAGLTAAYELVTKTNIKPVIIEKTNDIGGISKTVVYKGNRIDVGGHRFFSKSDTVMKWWLKILPLQRSENGDAKTPVSYHNKTAEVLQSADGPDPEKVDKVMLVRSRLSRIFFLGKFFSYPVSVSIRTLRQLGAIRILKILVTYTQVRLFPLTKVETLEDFFISRFGRELYETFFKDYTEKVWGIPCNKLSAEWGAQRIKKMSVSKAVMHATRSVFYKEKSISQKDTDTSLIDQFMYPKYGPGQMWETVADIVTAKDGIIIKNADVVSIETESEKVTGIRYRLNQSGEEVYLMADYIFSSMPVKELISKLNASVPVDVMQTSDGLQYRDFITVGLLVNKLAIKNEISPDKLISDNWIYIQEAHVKIGRLQIFNNWSPYMVADAGKVWIGLEYFCNQGDELWNMANDAFVEFAVDELSSIKIIDKKEVVDSTIIRMPKAYPAYFGTYENFDIIRQYTDQFENLFLIGRNGMHKYNNQDHSMLTAITAVENIINGKTSKENIWSINTEEDYHEANSNSDV
jgi:protoporphyrinogen oxidase